MSNKTGGKTFISGLTLSEVEHIKLKEEKKSPLYWEGLGGK